MTNKKASDSSIAVRMACGNTSASAIPEVSTQVDLSSSCNEEANRWTNSVSVLEYEMNTSATDLPTSGSFLLRGSFHTASSCSYRTGYLDTLLNRVLCLSSR